VKFLFSVIYRPFGFALGIAAGIAGRKIFESVWTKIDDKQPPKGITEQATWAKVLAAAALEGVIFKVTRVAVDRYGASSWRYLTGVWPGERAPDEE
jgi:hypothetical protein